MRSLRFYIFVAMAVCVLPGRAFAQNSANDVCPRPAAGSLVTEPEDLRSHDGVLKVDLRYRSSTDAGGTVRFCYMSADGSEAPTLRVSPGDLLIISLKNEIASSKAAASPSMPMHAHAGAKSANGCTSVEMSIESTNLHFHGLSVPPVCHQDDVLHTLIQPSDPAFEYRVQIPMDQPPGLYWYHPHVHGFSKIHVLGGASGALIVEGIERVNKEVAGLPERVLIIRDRDLVNPNAPPSKSEPVMPRMLIDHDGDAANTGTGFGRPAKDLSINFVPVPFPDYPPAVIKMKPDERELWRVLNASAITYLNLEVLYRRAPQMLGIVALDGIPINENGAPGETIQWVNHIGVPPGARVEFIVKGPAAGVTGLLRTRFVDTGVGGENDPNRVLSTIVAAADAPAAQSMLAVAPEPLPPSSTLWLGNVAPTRVRKLYFSEKLSDPNDPNSATTFYITVDGQTPAAFDPSATAPNIVVKQGDVEDWIIENRSTELHAFHIHQIHFMLLDWNGVPVNEPFLRDTVNVPFYTGRMLQYPSVRIRMDFRSPNIVGTFPYHCHLLEHEDGGMMGLVRVEPANESKATVNPKQDPKIGSASSRKSTVASF